MINSKLKNIYLLNIFINKVLNDLIILKDENKFDLYTILKNIKFNVIIDNGIELIKDVNIILYFLKHFFTYNNVNIPK